MSEDTGTPTETILQRQMRERRERATAPLAGAPANAGEKAVPRATQSSAVGERMRADQADKSAVILLVTQIEVKPQGRKTFRRIEELAENIRQHGQQQAVVVRELSPFKFELVAGERRLRAIRDVLKRDTIAARIAEDAEDAKKIRLLQLSENVQREDYEPLELAREMADMKAAYGWKNVTIAQQLHCSEGWVSKKLSLLDAPLEVQERIAAGDLSETEYFNNKTMVVAKVQQVVAGAKLKGADVRTPMLSVSVDTAKDIAKLLQKIATVHGANPVEIGRDAKKKDLLAILQRTKELTRLL